MENEILNLFLHNIHFEYDRSQKELRIPGFENVRFPLDDLTFHDGNYRFYIQGEGSNIKFSRKVDYFDKHPEGMTQITIPKIVFEGTQEEALAMNKTSYQKDWNFYVADQAVMDRLNGKLPVIEVYPGEQYYIDWRLKEFRHTENFSNRILVNDLEPIEDGRVYRMLFDKETKRNAEPLKGNENPDHIVFIDIPYELKLDPISVAREYGMKEIELLHSFPIQKELKATVRELSGQEKKELKNYLKKLSERKQMKNKTKRGRKLR